MIARLPLWKPITLGVSLVSLLLCVLGLPESRIGIFVNIVLIVLVLVGGSWAWLNLPGI